MLVINSWFFTYKKVRRISVGHRMCCPLQDTSPGTKSHEGTDKGISFKTVKLLNVDSSHSKTGK